MEPRDPDDPKGLIRESFRIDGISAPECRSILLDWALSLPVGTDQAAAAARLGAAHAPRDHPMTDLLHAAAQGGGLGQRRGGRAGHFARRSGQGETSR